MFMIPIADSTRDYREISKEIACIIQRETGREEGKVAQDNIIV